MYQALIIVHVLLAIGIIGLVLLQQGKGADAGAAFGSGASGTVFGAQGSATFLTRATAVLASLFFATSLGLAIVGDSRQSSEGFMDVPSEPALPTDLPPSDPGLNPETVTDMPSVPAANEESVIVEEFVEEPATTSPPGDEPPPVEELKDEKASPDAPADPDSP